MNNEPLYERELERWTDNQLKKLPLIKAPQSLKSKVIALIQKREEAHWWQKPIYCWSMPAKVIFTIVSMGLFVLFLWLLYSYGSTAFTDNSKVMWLYLIASKLNILLGFLKVCTDLVSAIWITFKWQIIIAGSVIAIFYGVSVGLATATFKLITRR